VARPAALALQVRLPYHESLVAVFDHPLLPTGGPCLRYCTAPVLAKGTRAGGPAGRRAGGPAPSRTRAGPRLSVRFSRGHTRLWGPCAPGWVGETLVLAVMSEGGQLCLDDFAVAPAFTASGAIKVHRGAIPNSVLVDLQGTGALALSAGAIAVAVVALSRADAFTLTVFADKNTPRNPTVAPGGLPRLALAWGAQLLAFRGAPATRPPVSPEAVGSVASGVALDASGSVVRALRLEIGAAAADTVFALIDPALQADVAPASPPRALDGAHVALAPLPEPALAAEASAWAAVAQAVRPAGTVRWPGLLHVAVTDPVCRTAVRRPVCAHARG